MIIDQVDGHNDEKDGDAVDDGKGEEVDDDDDSPEKKPEIQQASLWTCYDNTVDEIEHECWSGHQSGATR